MANVGSLVPSYTMERGRAEREVWKASKAVVLNLWVAKPLVVVGHLVPNDPFTGVP